MDFSPNKVLVLDFYFQQFERGVSHFNSTNRTDFKNYGPCLPDVKIRRDASLRQDVSKLIYSILYLQAHNTNFPYLRLVNKA